MQSLVRFLRCQSPEDGNQQVLRLIPDSCLLPDGSGAQPEFWQAFTSHMKHEPDAQVRAAGSRGATAALPAAVTASVRQRCSCSGCAPVGAAVSQDAPRRLLARHPPCWPRCRQWQLTRHQGPGCWSKTGLALRPQPASSSWPPA
jgi:hypothetical protein